MKVTSTGWTKESIQQLLETNDRAVVRAVVAIYKNQTQAEQSMSATVEHNGVGFSSVDAEFLTSVAESALKYGSLTAKQMAITRNKIKKYWKQLMTVADKSPVQYQARNDYDRLSNGY